MFYKKQLSKGDMKKKHGHVDVSILMDLIEKNQKGKQSLF